MTSPFKPKVASHFFEDQLAPLVCALKMVETLRNVYTTPISEFIRIFLRTVGFGMFRGLRAGVV